MGIQHPHVPGWDGTERTCPRCFGPYAGTGLSDLYKPWVLLSERLLDRGDDPVHVASLLRVAGVSDIPLRAALWSRLGGDDLRKYRETIAILDALEGHTIFVPGKSRGIVVYDERGRVIDRTYLMGVLLVP
jgi:hypothetical protein